jgi:hypothetical protein
VPERAGRHPHQLIGPGPERAEEAVERLGGQREQAVGVDLEAAVGGGRRLVGPLAPEAKRSTQAIEGERAHRRGAHVQRDEDWIGRQRRAPHAFMLAGGPAA